MFKHIQARRAALKAPPLVSEISEREISGYADALDTLRRGGALAPDDPRKDLDPVEIRQLSEMRQVDLNARFGSLAAAMHGNGKHRDDRVRGAAALRAQRAALQAASGSPARQAAIAEKAALHLAQTNPGDPTAKAMLTTAAAMSDRAQRERVMQGFATQDGQGNIAKAARVQGRSWIEVRDDLVKFNVLPQKDPRRKIRAADIDFQKGGSLRAGKIAKPEDLESQAMKMLKKDPRNEQAIGWLATTGALLGAKEAKQVKGTLPKRRSPFSKAANIEL